MIDFDTVPKVAFEEMNGVHKEEVELLNRIETALENNDESVVELCDELVAHTKKHFGNEERLMLEVGFPPFMMHKSEHERALMELETVVNDYKNKKELSSLKSYFSTILPAWLHQHISTMDTITAQFIFMQKSR